jgi:C1A family cysteine protease
MRNRARRGVLSLVSICAGAAWLVGCSGSVVGVDADQGDAGAPAEPTEPLVFTPLAPTAAFQAHDPKAPLEEAILPEGTFALGYVPTPVTIPQPPLVFREISAPLSTSFDLRATGRLSPIRDQGGCGSCWTFATYASSESGLLPGEAADYSEEHLNNAHGFDILPCNGGNSFMSMAYMSRWSGPIAEADAPYTGTAHGFTKVLSPKKHLTEAYVYPDRTGPLDNATLKNAVLSYGAVYTTMNWVSASWKGATNGYYNAGGGQANHAVAIVGWNDEMPTSAFVTAPAGTGAFLIRNSWGTAFGDAGYFYVSYYDAFIGKGNVTFKAFDPPTDFDAVYQYDKYGQTSALGYPSGTSVSANVFTAQAETNLQAVSFYTTAPAAQVTVSVHDAPTGDPSTGALAGTKASAQAIAGYHTVSLADLGVKLHAGRKFSVIVSVATTQAQSYLAVEYPFAGYSSKVTAVAGTGFVSGDGKSWTDTAKAWKANVPIKAFVAAAPSCDDQNACTADAWNGTQCTHTPLAAGTVCRASSGVCDAAEVCDGKGAACPADAFAPVGTVCRASAGDCDVAESCTGKAAACPADAFKPAVAVCRAASGACDVAEYCSGKAAACGADVLQKKGTVCRPSNGICDAAEACDGLAGACPADKAAPAGTVCRASSGVCDVAEACDGKATTCPTDGWRAAGTVCRASAGDCDAAEVCSGKSSGCPVDAFKPFGQICRAAAGDCDAAESCTGKAALCPADAIRPKGYVCRQTPLVACDGKAKVCK